MGFDPITLLGAAISGIGSIMSGMAAAQAANAQAEIDMMNAEINEDNAARAIHRSQIEAQDQDMLTAALIGEQDARQGASGLGGRSQLMVRKAARELGRKDALNVRQAGEIEGYNYRVAAAGDKASAGMRRQSAKFSMLEGFLGGASSLIGAARPSGGTSKFRSSYRTPAFPRVGSLVS